MNGDATRRYKDVAGLNTEATERMREADRALVEKLEQQLGAAERALAEVSERERVARMGVELHWEAAMEELWDERWLKLEPMPLPAVPAPAMNPLDCDTEVGDTYAALHEALRKPSMLPRIGKRESSE
ncbi:MAG TPA: hypothetical protein VHZ97_21170 [Pseudonocardiaceae bacterium]|nr:hypothetical protein [Pseudonocardiaceae bacterium]